MEFGILMGDQPVSTPPEEHLDLMLRKVEAAQRAGFTYLTIGQHYLYDGFRWFQPIPLLARLAAELDDHVRIGTTVLVGPVHHPVSLAEDLATLDVITRGKLVVGIGTGYLAHEYDVFGKPFKQRYSLLEELIEVMTKCWTEDRVTHHGRFFDIDDRPTHLHPIQKPRPPIWLGAMKETGVRRAARHGDVWTITPQQTIEQVEGLIGTYIDERARCGLPLTKFPLRRELQVAASYDDALRDFAEVARVKYVSYAGQGMQLLDQERVENEFLENVKDHVLLGTGDQVCDQIRDIAARLPIGPLLIRPHWPGMDAEQTAAYLERVGREVVAPLRDLESIGFEEFQPPVLAG
ncbi:LLM class flavin-dependent oxidoreductase [Nocardioides soli]|uniref:Alkanesulfonate monooxygenase SsuD/methylene tetrahydromethanopterin reductase-like flavin-dependent oxidoreductase (Luciferase family) n=1 Tax=Nocardioides soli TaxID=1036020 RepID=A0A7W4VWN6_9ACTN|nr:LLM class flavin-dependent oxidoreductase [Nocardioides soli]MBB3043161.1 alkanesulfonate monooxygenase SsuD/methylene tetrahydromethanopterin reductase-like flavin-dependent oxidoreductase (luciferase family) [Nocardioides soli]